MPRANRGPRLELYGPDERYGAKRKRGFRTYCYYIVWSERGRKCERSTGTSDLRAAQEKLRDFLVDGGVGAEQPAAPAGPRSPDQMTVADVLDLYGRLHAPTTADPARIGYAMDALLGFWAEKTVAQITATACRDYLAFRQAAFAEKERARFDAYSRKVADAAANGRHMPAAKPPRTLAPSTVRRELGTLEAALTFCVEENHLTQAPPVKLPPKGQARDRHLTRSEVARLIWEARKSGRAHLHLPLFILIAYYTGARRTAILQLQWQPNTVGGWVDLDRGVIDFLGAREQTNKRRTAIPIPERLMRFLRYARRRTRQYVIEYRRRDPADGKVKAMPIADPKKALASAGERAGLGSVFSHLLKHSAITFLVSLGVPLWQVAGWTGTSEETIRRVYGHHAPDYLEEVRKALR